MSSIEPIPVREIAMKNGINVGGFQYRTYQNGPQWDLYLHPVGGFVSLTLKETGATFYVSLSQVDCVEGYAASGVSTASPQRAPAPSRSAVETRFLNEFQGLVSNQNRVEVPTDPVRQIDHATDLGEPSEKDKRDKDAHFGTTKKEGDHLLPGEYIEELHPAPVKKKRGRPRKIRATEPEALS